MNFLRLAVVLVLGSLAAFLAGCSQGNSADTSTPVAVQIGLDRFLIFPNPQVQDNGAFQVVEQAYADAYYAAIDPGNLRTSLAGFKSLNQFDSGSGTQHLVVFRDTRDLGSGRRMIGRKNLNGTLAFVVENYRVDTGSGLYTSINVDAAVAQDTRWLFAVNAIEFSPLFGPPTANCGNCVAKFYNYDPDTGVRQTMVDLDTRGNKAMPTVCITCHGGRGDPLKADGSFPRTVTSLTDAGNTQARLQAFDVDSFEYSTQAGYTRADQESTLRDFNLWVLCSYPMYTGDAGHGAGINTCRPDANPNEWWSVAAANMIKVWYGDVEDGTNSLGPTFTGTFVPSVWAGHETLWNNVVAKYCRTCHILRGTLNENEIDFSYYDFFGTPYGFETYKDRIKAHVFDRGNMPLSLFVFQNIWNDTTALNTLADFLEDDTTTSLVSAPVRVGGSIPSIGHPIADPGPDRRVNSPATLSASGSLFATSYQWAVPGSCSAAIGDATARVTTLTWPVADGITCVVSLTVTNAAGQSHTKTLTLTMDSNIPPAPTFADIRTFFADANGLMFCTACHDNASDPASTGFTPPIFYTDYNRGGTPGTAGDGIYTADTTDDDYWFYKELRGRVNLTDYSASPLLRKPTGNHHGGGLILDVSDTTTCQPAPTYPSCQPYATLGEFYNAQYSILANWIVNGAPYK